MSWVPLLSLRQSIIRGTAYTYSALKIEKRLRLKYPDCVIKLVHYMSTVHAIYMSNVWRISQKKLSNAVVSRNNFARDANHVFIQKGSTD